MSTWWQPVSMSDTGLEIVSETQPFCITNVGMYELYRMLTYAGAEDTDLLLNPPPYIPLAVIRSWAGSLSAVFLNQFYVVMVWDEAAERLSQGPIIHEGHRRQYRRSAELLLLGETDLGRWLIDIALKLSNLKYGVSLSTSLRPPSPGIQVLTPGERHDFLDSNGHGIPNLRIGASWNTPLQADSPYQMDLSIIGVDTNDRALGQDWFIHYNRLTSPGGTIVHPGYPFPGSVSGDDAQLCVNMKKLPPQLNRAVVALTIFNGPSRKHSFAHITDVSLRLWEGSTEIARFTPQTSFEHDITSMVLVYLYRSGNRWRCKAIGDGFTDGLTGLVEAYHLA